MDVLVSRGSSIETVYQVFIQDKIEKARKHDLIVDFEVLVENSM